MQNDNTKNENDVLIVGAGPTGLVLAIWLARLGVKFRIIDRLTEAAKHSRALVVHARTLEFYSQMGFADKLLENGLKITKAKIINDGNVQDFIDFSTVDVNTPFPFMLVYPQEIHEHLLVKELESVGIHIEREVELIDFIQDANGVSSQLKRLDGSIESVKSRFICGCDGARSTVRTHLNIGFSGSTYQQVFYVTDVELMSYKDDHELKLCMNGANFVGMFPTPKGGVRLVGLVPNEVTKLPHTLDFEDLRADVEETIGMKVTKVNWFSSYLSHHRVADSFRVKRAFILGDAAHIHSPVGGQGMNTGIGDAVNLAWKIGAIVNNCADENLLETFDFERRRFAKELVNTTDFMFTYFSGRGFLSRFIRANLFKLLPYLIKRPSIARYVLRKLTQLHINYRGSSLSAGEAGEVQGGDRLPWVHEARMDNFVSLKSINWQIHVYGKAKPDLERFCQLKGLALHVFAWSESAETAGLKEDAVYLVRPDGYVALAEPTADVEILEKFFSGQKISCMTVSRG